MKKLWITAGLLLCMQLVNAQTFSEWFRQRRTQIRYLVTQIGALQIYIEAAQKGYEIANTGLTIIGNIKNGEFNLHRDFFGALERVSPAIHRSSQVSDIIHWQLQIMQLRQRQIGKMQHTDELNVEERNYLTQVYDRVLAQAIDDLEELTLLLASETYVMTDEDRISRVSQLYNSMQHSYGFARSFTEQTDVLIINRKKERQDAIIGSKLLTPK